MRQPTTEFHQDPFKIFKVTPVDDPDNTPQNQAYIAQFGKNMILKKSYNFCSAKCIDLSVGGKMADAEQSCMQQCVNKYYDSMKLYGQEFTSYNNTLAQIKLNGGDVYESRDI